MGVNKIVLNKSDGAETLIDLTEDTVTPETLEEGITAHNAAGERIVGTSIGTDFVGTTAEMQQKLASGELKDGTRVYLSDGGKRGTISDGKVRFEEAAERQNIVSGESLEMLFGKIEKWFTDLTQAANVINGVNQESVGEGVLDAAVGAYLDGKKFDVSKIVNTADVTESGYVLDAAKTIEWLSAKQNKFNLGSNTIHDLDSLVVGCFWYDSEYVTSGEKPFFSYGFILSFQASTSMLIQIAIPYGGGTSIPKWRSYVNNTWQKWKNFSSFDTTVYIPDSGSNLNNYTNSGSYFKAIFTSGSDTNYPCSSPGWLEVFNFIGTSGNIYVFQRYTAWGTDLVYTRFCNINGWTTWKQVGGVVSEVYKLQTNYANNLTFSRVGSVASFILSTPKNLKASDETLIGTVPAKFRPSSDCVFNLSEGGSVSNQIRILLHTDGQFKIWNYTTKTGDMNICDTLTYLLA